MTHSKQDILKTVRYVEIVISIKITLKLIFIYFTIFFLNI